MELSVCIYKTMIDINRVRVVMKIQMKSRNSLKVANSEANRMWADSNIEREKCGAFRSRFVNFIHQLLETIVIARLGLHSNAKGNRKHSYGWRNLLHNQ